MLDKLCAEVGEFPLPPAVLAEESQKELRAILRETVKKEEDIESFKKDSEKHAKIAEKSASVRLRNFFILRKIAKEEKIEIERNEMESRISGLSKIYGVKEKEFKKQIEESGAIEDLHMDMIMSKVTDYLVANAKIN